MDAQEAVVYLAGCAVDGVTPDSGRLAGLDPAGVLDLAAAHMLTACVSVALEAAGMRCPATDRAIADAVRRFVVFESAYAQVRQRLDAAGIWYTPLKGSVLKDDYPKPFMREMTDRDILYDPTRAQDVRDIMEGLGFTVESFGTSVHDIYQRPPILSFEMHNALFGAYHEKTLYEYYQNIAGKLLPGEGCARRFSPEDFYLYMTAHEYKHYTSDGTGLRSILDTYVFLKKHGDALDWAYIEGETDKFGISAFERRGRTLATRLFSGQPLDAGEREMLGTMLSTGAFGTVESHMKNIVRQYGEGGPGKLRYSLHRVFPSMEDIRREHPFIYRTKLLIPFFVLYRILRGLLLHGKDLMAEFRALRKIE